MLYVFVDIKLDATHFVNTVRHNFETVLPQPREQGNHPTQVELQSEPQKQDDVPLSHENMNPLRLKSSYAKNLGNLNSFNYSSNE